MKNIHMVALFTATLFSFIVSCSFIQPNESNFTLINKSTREISGALIEICGQKFSVDRMKPGESASFDFLVKSDSHYSIAVKFTSGEKLKKEIGYVTSGVIVKDSLLITENDILLESNKTIK